MPMWPTGAALPGLVLGAGVSLVSFWKPLLILIPWVPWAWLVSTVFDKHAQRFYLPRTQWNLVHLLVGLAAPAIALGLPIEGEASIWIGLGIMVVLLAADVAAFMLITNRDDRVPEEHRLSLDFSKLAEARKAKAAAKQQATVSLTIKGPDKALVAAPMRETPEFEVRAAAESLYAKALAARASQVDIGPAGAPAQGGPAYAISFLIDGVRQSVETIPAPNAQRLMDFWKSCAKLDANERRKRLTGDCTVEQETTKHKVRVTSVGGQAGMRATLLFDPEAAVRRKDKELGLLENQMAELKAITGEEHGVVLLVGPSDGGRTTTLYSVVKMHDAYTKNVQTVEFETQDAIEGVRQNVWEAQADGPEFSTLVRSILRRDPDVVGVAELPDANTAKEIVRADQERTRTYVSVMGDGALQGLQKWFKAVGDPDQAGKVLWGVVGHRLIRKLCPNCKVAYQPSPDMVKKLGLPPDKVKQLFKKGGQVLIKNKPEVCPMCQGVGYFGQDGLFEVYRVTNEDRELLRKGDAASWKAELRKRGQPSIQHVALRKAVDGITSVEEVMRVTAEGASATPGAPSAAPGAPGGAPKVAPKPPAKAASPPKG